MKCFYHPDADAVAICKNCNKGLCSECAVDVGNGIACKNNCEDKVIALNKTINLNTKILKSSTRTFKILSILCLIIGIISLVFGYLLISSELIFLSIFILLLSIVSYLMSRKYK
jgi:uncharacterized membrane protein